MPYDPTDYVTSSATFTDLKALYSVYQPPTTPKPTQAQAQAQAIIDDLQTALPYLQRALQAAKDLKLGDSLPDAYGDIVDVVTYCEEASDYLNEIKDA